MNKQTDRYIKNPRNARKWCIYQKLEITTKTAYIKAGLPVIEVANSKRIKKSDLDAFMTSHYVNNKEE